MQNFKKIEGGPFGDIKKLSKKKRKMIILNSLIVTKNVEGGLWAFSTSLQLQNIKKKLKGDPLKTKKIRKNLIVPKKIERGDPLVSSGFVGYVKKLKMKGGGSFGDKNFSKKKSHSAEKNQKGGLFQAQSGFVGYLGKVKKTGGTFGLSLPWPRTWH